MKVFDDLRHGQRAVRVGQPMQIDAKTRESSLLRNSGTSSLGSLSIMLARLTMRTLCPSLCRCAASVRNPKGYISKTGVEGTRSETGP